mgnify:CR=1 FL=1
MPYFPLRREISGLTNAKEPTVTFTEAHGYLLGQLLRFHVHEDWGMPQINDIQGKVLTIPLTTTVTVDIETTTFGSFSIPASSSFADPVCVPVASGNITESGISRPNINCAFDKRRP